MPPNWRATYIPSNEKSPLGQRWPFVSLTSLFNPSRCRSNYELLPYNIANPQTQISYRLVRCNQRQRKRGVRDSEARPHSRTSWIFLCRVLKIDLAACVTTFSRLHLSMCGLVAPQFLCLIVSKSVHTFTVSLLFTAFVTRSRNYQLFSFMASRWTQKARVFPPSLEIEKKNHQVTSSAIMSVTETQQRPTATCIDEEPTIAIPSLSGANPRSSLLMSLSGPCAQDVATPRAFKKTKDDIRYYFRPTPKEDIRVYFRPISKLMPDRPRAPRGRTVSTPGKPKVRSRRVSPTGRASPSPGPEVPPKAKERTLGQKNRDIFLSKQREIKSNNGPGRANQNGSTALPGFDPNLATHSAAPPTTPLSPRITEVVDSSLMPSPLRNKSDVAAESAPEYDDRADKQRHHAPPSIQAVIKYQQSIPEEYQQTLLPQKPNSIYGTLPPLPVRLQRNNSQPNPHSPRLVRHRRQDTPYSPNDVGRDSALDSPELPEPESATSDPLDRSSSYASSDVLPTPVALEEWASEQRRIAHGQPAMIQRGATSTADNDNDKDKTLKKTKSTETRLFRSRKSKVEKKDKGKSGMKEKFDVTQSVYRPQASRSLPREPQHPGMNRDMATLPPSPEIVRPSFTTMSSEIDDHLRSSDSMSDKMVVTDPQLIRVQADQNPSMTMGTKTKKPNKLLRMLESYSKNMEGLQMVQ